MRGRKKRCGLTLLEMLVMAVILAVGMALLLPALQLSREKARTAACLNNMGRLVLAVHNYAQANRMFPPSSTVSHPSLRARRTR